jgi:hypothetical protein
LDAREKKGARVFLGASGAFYRAGFGGEKPQLPFRHELCVTLLYGEDNVELTAKGYWA